MCLDKKYSPYCIKVSLRCLWSFSCFPWDPVCWRSVETDTNTTACPHTPSLNMSSATTAVFRLIISHKERKKTNITSYKKHHTQQICSSHIKAETDVWNSRWTQQKQKRASDSALRGGGERHERAGLQSFSLCHAFNQVLSGQAVKLEH